ncbi:TetR family transcriptional regulator [Streptococcus sp. zg-86]|uniref:TetR family transcriptional regulator n=1 Tax=Streptococcus zhangguiae TaxID=2664091 RepID=A0A6I4RI17_9STRE|nr:MULTISPECIES: TetR/AcrR family transcriptional regulator [unclassified Streptococcus]MTB64153.1 TetR family transcriptional regulator [Streptococcus sp. zg-86]MTB90521.1 TetR family transcriptional regulator [Streptococcus sp. zg-36]MWV56141.1 TetR family transcriptional regulator [Streptococcus sp. zg-70]QTH48235.1 TetR/AcrR family transcriptional regulator [Streptococcus sp. zg-86]
MARPRKTEYANGAVVKIENAFWKLLETEKYTDITVLRIAQDSGVNRNSFYYHYKDMDDLAYQAFKNNTRNDASRMMISSILTVLTLQDDEKNSDIDMSILPNSRRIMLCARSESTYLKQLVNDFLKEIWLDSFSINEDRLTTEEKIQLDFIFAGIVTTLGSQEIEDNPLLMLKLVSSEIGKSMLLTMKKISVAQNNRFLETKQNFQG